MTQRSNNYRGFLSEAEDRILPSKPLASSVISIVVHGLLLLVLMIVPYVFKREQEARLKTHETVRLYVAPKPPPQRIVAPPPTVKPTPLPEPTHALVAPPVRLPEPVVPKPKPVEVVPTPAPQIVAAVPAPPVPPSPPPVTPPAPKKPVVTDVFASSQPAVQQMKSRETHVGEFGDVNGNKASTQSKSSMLTTVGGFETAVAGNQAGSRTRGSYQETSFGSGAAGGVAGSHGSTPGAVKTGAFGDATAAQAPVAKAKVQEAVPTPVEILAKPKPAYTAEARALKVEGDVSLEVVFLATGQVRVVRVVHGLGHGLDEEAMKVASAIRFKPSTRDGVAVDSKAIIHVTFELA
jgi:TonB family protein